LMVDSRLCSRGKSGLGPVRTSFQVDSDRITFSNAFRRLQGKTQVYPLPDDDHVHTRLTHSLEVASAGRSIGNLVGQSVMERHPDLADHISFRDLGDCVHAACLAHDLGNPPFGHSGEEAIRTWFTEWMARAPQAAQLTPAQRADLVTFEGNAQGFRLLTSRELNNRDGGLQLTHATLAAFTKYPRGSGDAGEAPTYKGKSVAKLGFYQAELQAFQEVVDAVGLLPRQGYPGAWCRHPLAFLVEAADDICYLILDQEDGHRLGYLPHELYVDLMAPIAACHPSYRGQAPGDDSTDAKRSYGGVLRAMAVGVLIQEVAKAFTEHEPQILTGEMDRPLTSCIPQKPDLDRIERESIRTCYQAREVVEIELAGFEVLGALLERFVTAALHPERCASRKLRTLFPWIGSHDEVYTDLLSCADYISGMTDSYAVSLYRRLAGHSLPGRRR
jgi:dGTPase